MNSHASSLLNSSTLCLLVPLAITYLHVLLSPYTKVEESFTLHVVHDVLVHGLDIGKWDHVTFPGAVPRSFAPGIVLGVMAWGPVRLATALGLVRCKVDVQIIVRLVLATFHTLSFAHLSHTIQIRFGRLARTFLIALSMTQFHIPYYAGRTLPNFTALPGVMLALSLIIRSGATNVPAPVRRRKVRIAIALFTALATNARLELAVMIAPVVMCMLVSGMVRVGDAMVAGAVGGFGALLIAGPIDYLLWSRALPHPSLPTFTSSWQIIWPELSAMAYNILEGQSANWGIMPRHYYLSNSLPKLLMGSLPLAGAAVAWTTLRQTGLMKRYAQPAAERTVFEVSVRMGLGVGAAGMIAALSCIGHKEWRFVVYVVPVLNVLAAVAAATLWMSSPTPFRLRTLVRLGLLGILTLQLAATGFLTFISANNYPGGEVWRALDALQVNTTDPVTVHFSSYPLQTGASLFTFTHDDSPFSQSPLSADITRQQIIYSKDETPALLTPDGATQAGLGMVVLESGTERPWLKDGHGQGRWRIGSTIRGLKGVTRGGKYGVRVEWADRVVILQRNSLDGAV